MATKLSSYGPFEVLPGHWRYGRRTRGPVEQVNWTPVGYCSQSKCLGHESKEEAADHFLDFCLDMYYSLAQGAEAWCRVCGRGASRWSLARGLVGLLPARWRERFGRTTSYVLVTNLWVRPLCRRHRDAKTVKRMIGDPAKLMN